MAEYQSSEVSAINTNQAKRLDVLSKHSLWVELQRLFFFMFFIAFKSRLSKRIRYSYINQLSGEK